MSDRQPRACIVTNEYLTPGETFINRHIVHLFGGNTCVVCERVISTDPFDKEVFARERPIEGAERALVPLARLFNSTFRGMANLPFGSAKRAYKAFLRDQEVDVILVELGNLVPTAIDVARELGIPCFGYFRGADASSHVQRPKRVRAYRRTVPQLAGIFAVSQFLLDRLAAIGVTHPNAHVVPSGVDVRRFAPGDKVPRSYLAVGRMIRKKAPDITLRAFAAATDGTGATLRFIGDGPLMASTQALARDLGVADRVTFDGFRDHDAVREILAGTQVFLQHSVTAPDGNTEGLPTAIQEALAAGCIVISTRHAGIPEAIDHGVNGWLGAEHDVDGFADLIRQSLTADTAAMSRAARATAEERFDNDKLLIRTERLLRAGLDDHGTRPD